MKFLKTMRCPSDEWSFTNYVSLNRDRWPVGDYVSICVDKGIFAVKHYPFEEDVIGFNSFQRKWLNLPIGETVEVIEKCMEYKFDELTLEIDFLNKIKADSNLYNVEILSNEFKCKFKDQPLNITQTVGFHYNNKKFKIKLISSKPQISVGLITETTVIMLKSETVVLSNQIPNVQLNWNFEEMGVGGLDREFSLIFRRAFASRSVPIEIIKKLGCKHIKGILLHGPPGCGKTLMARCIAQAFKSRPVKIVNGPELLNKYVGESEANVRKLFQEAEEEQKKAGLASKLHVIVFDEIDALCKKRGDNIIHDAVVNQLLSKIDGVESLNNILIVGMTNRPDLIDDALLRPGRLELKIEIGLPDKEGRLQILKVHVAKMKSCDILSPDVDLNKIAAETKNYSGAELEGLVRAAQSTALSRCVKVENGSTVSSVKELKVMKSDFEKSLNVDVKPVFQSDDYELPYGVVIWTEEINRILNLGRSLITRTQEKSSSTTLLLEGKAGCGKTALAITTAQESQFSYIKICSSDKTVGYSETDKRMALTKIFSDALKFDSACIVLDDLERWLDYVPIGPRFSNSILQTLFVLLKSSSHKLLIIVTCEHKDFLDQTGLTTVFDAVVRIPCVSTNKQLMDVLKLLNVFDAWDRAVVLEAVQNKEFEIGIKKLIAVVEIVSSMQSECKISEFLTFLETGGIFK
ncbi:cell division protein 48 [lymphocystis disease virus-China]|uniref:Vesicle-fusing ATPase-like n=2 Tax=Lymphocystis disease virus 2 TaxID=159183 RepID=A0A6F8X1B5_9VIRU|nr:cell division protein 48 [lymphocystis disease virus-China]AAU11051.1 cell division protein 48 [lymphocystis disease virus-China]BCB67535.1 vesicle-fusing ATPase-like [Lymphocystis disease virus 2]